MSRLQSSSLIDPLGSIPEECPCQQAWCTACSDGEGTPTPPNNLFTGFVDNVLEEVDPLCPSVDVEPQKDAWWRRIVRRCVAFGTLNGARLDECRDHKIFTVEACSEDVGVDIADWFSFLKRWRSWMIFIFHLFKFFFGLYFATNKGSFGIVVLSFIEDMVRDSQDALACFVFGMEKQSLGDVRTALDRFRTARASFADSEVSRQFARCLMLAFYTKMMPERTLVVEDMEVISAKFFDDCTADIPKDPFSILIDTFCFILDFVEHVRSGAPLLDFVSPNKVLDKYAQLKSMQKMFVNDGIEEAHGKTNEEYLADINSCLIEMRRLRKSSRSSTLYMTYIADLEQWRVEADIRIASSQGRVPPLGILLDGPPGVGKTFFIERAVSVLGTAFNFPHSADSIGTVNPGDAYDSHMSLKTRTVISDDLGATKSQYNRGRLPQEEVILYVNTTNVMANMANLEGKGCIPIRPRLYCATTNDHTLGLATTAADPGAVYRRFHVKATVNIIDEVKDSNGAVDAGKARALEAQGRTWQTFTLFHMVPTKRNDNKKTGKDSVVYVKTQIGEPLSCNDFLDVLCREYRNLHKRAKTASTIEFPKYCFRCMTVSCKCEEKVTQEEQFGEVLTGLQVWMAHALVESIDSIPSFIRGCGKLLWQVVMGSVRSMVKRTIYSTLYDPRMLAIYFMYVILICCVTLIIVPWYETDYVRKMWVAFLLVITTLLSILMVVGAGYEYGILVNRRVRNAMYANARDSDIYCVMRWGLVGLVVCYLTKMWRMFMHARNMQEQSGELIEEPNRVAETGAPSEKPSSLTPTTSEAVKKRANAPNMWTLQTVDLVAPKRKTSLAEHVQKAVANNSIHLITEDDDEKRYQTNGTMLDAKTCVIPHHAVKHFEKCVKVYGARNNSPGGLFQPAVSKISQVGNKDLALLELTNVPAFASIMDLLPTEKERPSFGSIIMVTTDDNGDKILSKGQWTGSAEPRLHSGYANGTYESSWGGNYPIKTLEGMCGSPILMVGTKCIAGFHVSGNGHLVESGFKGGAVTLFQEDMMGHQGCELEIDVNYYGEDFANGNGLHERSCVQFCPDGVHTPAVLVGTTTITPNEVRSQVRRSKISEHLEHEDVPCQWGKPRFSRWRNQSTVYQNAIDAMKSFPKQDLDAAVEDYLAEILPWAETYAEFDGVNTEVLSDFEIVNGRKGSRYIKGMNMTTSGGPGKTGPKSQYFAEFEDPETGKKTYQAPDDIMDQMARLEYKMANGVVVPQLAVPAAKDEPTKLVRIVDGNEQDNMKVRLFTVCPVYFNMILRKYLLPIVEFFGTYPLIGESAVGIQCLNPDEWGQLAEHLTHFGSKNIMAGDYSAYDQRQTAQLILAAGEVYRRVSVWLGYDEDEAYMVEACFEHLARPMIAFGCGLVLFQGYNTSGNAMTVHTNGIVNSLLHRLFFVNHFRRLRQPAPSFRSVVKLITYGDDSVAGVDENHPWFNMASFQKYLKKYNMPYTDPHKSAIVPQYMDFADVDFCKRQFVLTEYGWNAPLALSAIYKSLHMTMSSVDDELDALVGNVINAFRELWQHGEDVFNCEHARIMRALKAGGYDEYHQKFRFGFHDWTLELKDQLFDDQDEEGPFDVLGLSDSTEVVENIT